MAKDLPVRLSTNGLGSILHGRDITPDLIASGFTGVTIAINSGEKKGRRE